MDDKYYSPTLEPNLKPQGQPGIESVIKQYMYQLSFKPLIEAHGFEDVQNCFIMPSENSQIEDKKCVSLEMLPNLGLKNIRTVRIPVAIVFDAFLNERTVLEELLNDSIFY